MNISKIITNSLNESLKVNKDSVIDDNFFQQLEIASSLLIETFKNNGKVLLAGNGGSAADCQHIAAEFIGRLNFDREPLPAIALTANTSNLTCIANDYGYEKIFSRQIKALAKSNDTLIVYSTSGKSKNIINALVEARPLVKSIISLTGAYTNDLIKYSDAVLSVNTAKTTRIQEIHAIAGHIMCECVEETLFDN
ncbi:MAG: SIS domain-containing protein [Gammaproteobacteria bacterium]|nr:SIS domain-containing protein [Gammaproteobacteria bacterium]MBL6818959.1 SIS domain-containing protein [Gammaproteobacteria bacterium]MBL6898942.1 SIS domain-containing protein [Gammaproteobacteria bacterium]